MAQAVTRAPQPVPVFPLVLGAWALAAAVVGATGALNRLPLPTIPAVALVGTVGLSLAYFRDGALYRFVDRVGIRRMTLFHAWRIGPGLLFLAYMNQGLLPPAFALEAGWGDVASGLLAAAAGLLPFNRARYVAVHLIGLADLVIAISLGATLSLQDPAAMSAVRHLPLALIPLFGVPVTAAAHIMALHLLRRDR